ncbi:pseudouridine-5'-phosphate glycosidase [Jannaschia sp. Os4]|uniref:pseudouridine-5'-phosphate glycosidase n=1 Tax=Jannaschia sp. Os4 TaxID=2807617 RepID=UPI00193A1EE0|nr:pseudouridine-5'-phosphate glycosidase [Jannaschia sp. Os4]MBM2574710.1 pseudouridine-5'-phosphate glycosidase [Jannaschia sp. Os4]
MAPDLSEEVADARAEGRAIVALESTIVSHGMPWPRNAEVARAVEDVVRSRGAVPATCAVVDGRLRAGLDDAALERLGRGGGVVKAASRDLAAAVARGRSAGTTVSATMRIAHAAGIGIFATGGIGGVHRGDAADVSADLYELAATPVCVVCAGAKSILDIPRTLELLESLRVPVLVEGADEMPAFYARASGCAAPERVDGAAEIASILRAHAALGTGSGVLVANPIPEADALDADAIGAQIEAALGEAARRGVAGKDVTPFLLAHLNAHHAAALDANVALVRANAALAADVALEVARRPAGDAG